MGLLFFLETVFSSLLLLPVEGRTRVSLGRDGDMIVVDNMARSLLRFYCDRLVRHGTFGPPSENSCFAAHRYYHSANNLKVTWPGSFWVNKCFELCYCHEKGISDFCGRGVDVVTEKLRVKRYCYLIIYCGFSHRCLYNDWSDLISMSQSVVNDLWAFAFPL